MLVYVLFLKHHPTVLRYSAETHLCLDGSEGDDDMWACFPCPFCYMDIEVAVLCTHLHEEHCFDIKNVVSR